ncbi:hypothetical protein LTR91_020982 [Friedmanniomyces endolithicus]|uniref:Uncharacterized protein n=1 Tax=Friedmanniomyces endolithicus TaxID=329885 RepID=A0A4U0U9C0_9PEZI|nr:hypothetical protein LTS09_003413 [Friedmanniomyces endolithicus]KAK0343641.1 hypothetical protein LTR94_017587 [Friedmanniomyces endolithicus]KAK0774266.1 hypothetical protein LTR59_014953 [Friedmanniomyces endolithicus]KAK0778487.1 hypothetical protein LTR38_014781 [Friedmanniomyces endolithicus]KAK0781842.1 hypothetical protein LTR75_014583 [Friedmanniomyces endolithicus]
MSRFFPRADYAEDQPFARTILTSHVLYRGFQTGATLAIPIAGIRAVLQARKGVTRAIISASALRRTGAGALLGTVLMVPALMARMWGREEIEWRDRSWRLLVNEGQVEVDDFSLVGAAGGVAVATTMRIVPAIGGATRTAAMLTVAGSAGLGTMAGVAGYMTWRYGVQGGKRLIKP